MEKLIEFLPFLIPLVLIQFALTITSIVHVMKHPNYRFGSKPVWILVSFLSFIGPIAYFTFGKGEE